MPKPTPNTPKYLAVMCSRLMFCGLTLAGSMYAELSAFDDSAQFSISAEDADYLRYLEYRNSFDYAGSLYMVGEFRLDDNNGTQNIHFTPWPGAGIELLGSTNQGIDAALMPAGKTESFVVAGEGQASIQFFRDLSGWAPSNAFPDLPPDNEDPDYDPTPWDVLDDSEWVIQVIRSSDGAHVYTLDSAGIPAHNDPNLDVRYGKNVKKVEHVVDLPTSLNGETVHLQIVPKRSGPTPYGMKLRLVSSWVTLSSLFNEFGVREDVDAVLKAEYMTEVLNVFDAAKSANGWIPDMQYLYMDDTEKLQLKQRYFQTQEVNGQTIFYEVNTKPQSTISTIENADGTTTEIVQESQLIIVEKLAPQPLNSAELTLEFRLRREMELSISFATISGRTVETLWEGKFDAGRNSIDLQVPFAQAANGSYFLILKSTDGKAAVSAPIQLARR